MGPKKQKQTMSLGNFLSDQTLGSWADEMEDMPMPSSDSRMGYGGDRGERRGFGSGGDFGDRPGFERNYMPREQLPIPTQPPFTAHLGNLSFDVTQGDIDQLFADCNVTNIRLVEDKLDRKPKGFGYVEFATQEGLKKALEFHGTSLQNRQLKISVADPPKDRPPTREINDWTRKGPLPDISQPNRRTSTGPRNFEPAGSDFSSEGRSTSRRGGAPFDGDKGPARDITWERRGPLSPVAPPSQQQVQPGGPTGPRDRPGRNRAPERSFERRSSPAWGEGTSREGSRPPRPVPERVPTAAEMDNQWRKSMRPDPPTPTTQTPEASMPSSPAATQPPRPIASRPKLNLQKRTVSSAPDDAPASASDSKASPFGAARPIDTASKEAEIAKKLDEARAVREAEEKAKAEKQAAEGGAQAPPSGPQQGGRKGSNRNSVPPTPTRTGSEQNGAGRGRNARHPSRTGPPGGANDGKDASEEGSDNRASRYEILSPEGEEDADGAVDAPANGTIVDDKNVKPKEIVREPGAAPDDTAQQLENDGWETVPKGKGHRRGASQAAPRAMAS